MNERDRTSIKRIADELRFIKNVTVIMDCWILRFPHRFILSATIITRIWRRNQEKTSVQLRYALV